MTLEKPTPLPEQETQKPDLLARSAFALLLVGALATLIVGIVLLGAPMRDSVRLPLLILYGIFFVLVVAALGATLVMPVARIHAVTHALTRLFGRPAPALALVLLIMVGTALAVPLINNIVSNLSALSLLLMVWSTLLVLVLAICNAGAIARLFERTRGVWTGIGITLVLAFIVLAIFTGANLFLSSTLIIDRLRGSSDFRELLFYGNEANPEQSRAYWTELGGIKNTWLSYTYTRMQAFQGQYINIDASGRRATTSFADEANGDVPDVYFFGGSTMWGEGSRDEYTIPSQVARLLNEAGTPIRASNYGQIAYVSTQDAILFERQLALGNVPDNAVFYGGFNDLASVYIANGIAGLPHNEVNRQKDLISGQILRDGRPLLSQPNVSIDDLDFSLIAIHDAMPAQVVDLYLANLRLIRAVAREFGVQTLFVWQPAILYKQSLTPQEQILVDENRRSWPGFDEYYQAVDEALRRRVRDEGIDDLVILSDLFADETRYLFYDRVHVIEDANTMIAQAIVPELTPLLNVPAENP